MQSLLIVVPFDKFLDVGAQVIEVAVLVGVDFLPVPLQNVVPEQYE
jgi:hypothetical protein